MPSDEKFLQLLAQQQEFMKKQTELLNCAMDRLNSASNNTPVIDSRSERTMETLSKCIQDFHYDPENNVVFEDWYARYVELFDVDAASLDDASKVRLLIRKLDTTAHSRFSNYILPKTTRNFTFDETKEILYKIFDRQTTLFNVRYNCMKMVKQSHEDFVAYAGIVNKKCEQFKLKDLTSDQFKCLIFICGLSANEDADIRTKLLSLIETDKDINLDKLTSETIRLKSLKHDTKMIEQQSSAVQHISHHQCSSSNRTPNGKTSSSKTPKSPCWFCGGMHYVRYCQYKTHQCAVCKKVGHKDGFCKKNTKVDITLPSSTRNHYHKQQRRNNGPKSNGLFLINNINYVSQRKFITVLINDVPVKLQIDTASDITIISQQTWQKLGKPNTNTPDHSARNASGGTLKLTAQFNCNISLNTNNITGTCYVSNIKDLNLMGIDWINSLGLWDVPISSVCHQVNANTNSKYFFESLQRRFKEVFSSKLGMCTKAHATLNLKPNAKPVFRPKRPVPYAALPAVEKELQRLENIGVISKVDYSSWAAPIVATRKSNGEVRICGDFSTGLNDALESHQYPLPLPEDIFSTLTGGQFFSKIDLADAYLQIGIDDTSKRLLTINTHRGLYQYNRLCFGVKSAPGIFQQVIDTMLSGLHGVVSYLDDIIIVGKTEATHRENVINVIQRIQEWGFHIKTEKCRFLLPRIQYLGFIIDKEGRRPDPDKIDSIAKMPPPNDLTTLRSFLGMINYYGQFIRQMRQLRAPFDKLLVKNTPWFWSKQCQASFEQVKVILKYDLLLTHFDPQHFIKVAADA